ncbi:hypothetical protein Trydic_g8307 [Trypoxylus dichotomus]
MSCMQFINFQQKSFCATAISQTTDLSKSYDWRNYNKYQDNVCERLFQFTNDQVRVVLFRECDFRGRKLLFDSQAVQKVPLANQTSGQQETNNPSQTEKEKKAYAEVSNGYGYLYARPNSDIQQLSEMIFGSVAMSYRGTSYKIHSLASPSRFMCTQVFPCPRQTRGGRYSAPGRTSCGNHNNHCSGVSSLSLDHSSKLEDSSTSCTTSFSDQSVHSTASDTLLVCRRNRSVPLDVPQTNNGVSTNIPNGSVVGDSGFGGDQSCGSCGSSFGPQSFPHCETNSAGNSNATFSCGGLYKRWLRSASTSLEYSTSSLTGSASADECYLKPHPRTRKLGLAIIIQLTNGQEENIQKFLLEHAALIEALVWRVRHGAEVAFLRHVNFLSLMSEVTTSTARWLIGFLTGPHLSVHMWRSLSSSSSPSNCDSSSSISGSRTLLKDGVDSQNLNRSISQDRLSCSVNSGVSCTSLSNSLCESSGASSSVEKTTEFTFLNLSRFFRNDCDSKRSDCGGSAGACGSDNRSLLAEKFVRELCELLESVDVKHTNFFISTLVTAVLTHHLGWVATALDSNPNDEEALRKLQKTSNPLWGQLNDLYGAVGSPTKMAHTIITGSNKPELITKILNFLTYFIRCSDVLKKSCSRCDVVEENSAVDRICREKRCIPKENYKKYQDHLDEMAACNSSLKKIEVLKEISLKLDDSKINHIMRYSQLKELDEASDVEINSFNHEVNNLRPSKGLSKTSTCLSDLSKIETEECSQENNTLSRTNHNTSLSKTTTCLNELNKMAEVSNEEPNEDNVSNNTVCFLENSSWSTPKDHFGLTNEDIHRKVRTLFRGLKDVPKYHSNQEIHKLNKMDLERQRSSSSTVLNGDQNKSVVFILGDDEPLVGLKKQMSQNLNKMEASVENNEVNKESCNAKRNSIGNIPGKNTFFSIDSSIEEGGEFKDSDFVKYNENYNIKPSTSWNHLEQIELKEKCDVNQEATCSTSSSDQGNKKKSFLRSQSEPPEHVKDKNNTSSKPRFKYTGVKFNFQQHQQIFTNYMRSKNIELSNLSFAEKAMKFNGALSTNFDFTNCEDNFEEVEALQTPSNASELEFMSELGDVDKADPQQVRETTGEKLQKTFKRNFLPNTIIREPTFEGATNDQQGELKKNTEKSSTLVDRNGSKVKYLNLIELPMPKSIVSASPLTIGYTSTLFRGISECYISDMVLQGISVPKTIWETSLRKDLTLTARHPLLDQPVDEAIAIIADTDTWEVQLMSSHTYVIDKGSSGIRIGMSQLIANMLESLLHMWKLHTPPEYCLMHIEQRLQEFCTRSKALAEMLLATDFCSMELLTNALQLEVNDIPLLMAVASTHSPQITQKYGLSFQ